VSELSRVNSSVVDLFSRAFNPTARRPCSRESPRTRHILESLSAAGFIAMYDNAWLRANESGAAKCQQEFRLAATYVELVEAWVAHLGGVNESVAIVYMEGWAAGGASYVRTLLRMLRLDQTSYPWRKAAAAFARPVYQNVASKKLLLGDGSTAPPPHWLSSAHVARVRGCDRLYRVTGMRPPWCADEQDRGTAR
jgi:hypothetical protein